MSQSESQYPDASVQSESGPIVVRRTNSRLKSEVWNHFDILQWWKRNSDLYPTLAKMARDFLAVQVSTVASESAFSAAGRLTDHSRNSMNAETIQALICSRDWFYSVDGGFDLDQFRPFMRVP